MNPTTAAALICLAGAIVEGLLSGGSPRARLAELRLPSFSPPFGLWVFIGIAYYLLCFILLRQILADAGTSRSHGVAIALLMVILLLNGFWNYLFFRLRTLRGSFLAFIPYLGVVVTLAVMLVSIYPLGALLLAGYLLYLLYATWWTYRVWKLNPE